MFLFLLFHLIHPGGFSNIKFGYHQAYSGTCLLNISVLPVIGLLILAAICSVILCRSKTGYISFIDSMRINYVFSNPPILGSGNPGTLA